jgi:Ca2+-binding RTX toxin-like protein
VVQFIQKTGRAGDTPGEDGQSKSYNYSGGEALELGVEGGAGAPGLSGADSGGNGGHGGDARAFATGMIADGPTQFRVNVSANGGAGGDGGDGNTVGGNGGAGGDATAAIRNCSITDPSDWELLTWGLQAVATAGNGGSPGAPFDGSGSQGADGAAAASIIGNTVELSDVGAGIRFSAVSESRLGLADSVIARNVVSGGDSINGQNIIFDLRAHSSSFGNSNVTFSQNKVALGTGDDQISLVLGEIGGGFSGQLAEARSNTLDGGAGIDTLEINANATTTSAISVNLDSGRMTLGALGADHSIVIGVENVHITTPLNNEVSVNLIGNDLANIFSTGDGSDNLIGRGGDDALSGGRGDDVLSGGTGKDGLEGGMGKDVLTGGSGKDVYIYSSGIAAESTSTGFDELRAVDFANDKFAFDFIVSAVGSTQNVASLSDSGFDATIASAVAGHLSANGAILLDVAGGGYAGHLFLVADRDGSGSYSAGADYIMDVSDAANIADLSTADFVMG